MVRRGGEKRGSAGRRRAHAGARRRAQHARGAVYGVQMTGPIGRLGAPLVAGALLLSSTVRPVAQAGAAPAIERLELAVDRLMADRPFVAAGLPPAPTDAADTALLAAALGAPEATVRALAVRSVGRFEDKARVPTLLPLLDDPAAAVEREAGNAIA